MAPSGPVRQASGGSNNGGSTLVNEISTPANSSSHPITDEKGDQTTTAAEPNISFQDVPLENDPPKVTGNKNPKKNRTAMESFRWTCWHVLTYSWVNVLFIFAPAGIAVGKIPSVHGGIVFALNCVAVIPLVGLLAHSTEVVASELGDILGALMNVTFGNVVELIIL